MQSREQIVVALSGGVDSSVAAALLVEQGYNVLGLMLHLWSEPGAGTENRCCTPKAVEDARNVAAALGIPFRLINCTRRFREQVVDYFIREYTCGRTPNPCLACNRHIKFGYLLQVAQSLDREYLATGHYARVHQANGQYQLLRGLDASKDQSYFLYTLGQEQLGRVMFPLGTYTKPQVRDIARRFRLPVAEKQESQDICFVRDQDYRRFLRTNAPQAIRPGPILDAAGREIGRHEGLPFYTIGQRRGLGIAWPEPLYVRAIDAERNALIVGPASQLGRYDIELEDVSFVAGAPPPLPASITLKIRYTGHEASATLCPGDEGPIRIHLDNPLRDITPGQGAVFYQGDVVLGGGTITESPPKVEETEVI